MADSLDKTTFGQGFNTCLSNRNIQEDGMSFSFELDADDNGHFLESESEEDNDYDGNDELQNLQYVRKPRRYVTISRLPEFEQVDNFEDMLKDGEWMNVTDDSLIKKQILNKGNGKVLEIGTRICFYYWTCVEGAEEPFDYKIERGRKKAVITVGESSLIGFNLALLSMQMLEVSKFWVHSRLAFGEAGAPPRIPKNSDILYAIEILEIIIISEENLSSFSKEELDQLSFAQVYSYCNKEKEKGNTEYRYSNYGLALKIYKKTAIMMENYGKVNFEEDQIRNYLLYQLYINMSQIYLKQKRFESCCSSCKFALNITLTKENKPMIYKAFYRFAAAKYYLGHHDVALSLCDKALKYEIDDKAVKVLNNLKSEINASKERIKKEEKELAKRMFNVPINKEKPEEDPDLQLANLNLSEPKSETDEQEPDRQNVREENSDE